MSDTSKSPPKPALRDALKALAKAVHETHYLFDSLDKSDLPVLLKYFKALHEAHATLKDNYESISTLYRHLSYEVIPELMEANGFDSVKANGRNFIVSARINASLPEDKRSSGLQWLRDNGYSDYIIQNVNPKSLSSLAREYFETHGSWPPDDVMTIFTQRYTSIRKA